jgi:hypothetical protein
MTETHYKLRCKCSNISPKYEMITDVNEVRGYDCECESESGKRDRKINIINLEIDTSEN